MEQMLLALSLRHFEAGIQMKKLVNNSDMTPGTSSPVLGNNDSDRCRNVYERDEYSMVEAYG